MLTFGVGSASARQQVRTSKRASAKVIVGRAKDVEATAGNLKHLKLRHLSCALDIARMGSVRAAADVLCVTESAISKTLRELEEQLGVRLFSRSKNGMLLTEAGKQFTSYANSALEAIHTGFSIARGEGIGPATVIKVGAMAAVSATFLPDVVRRFLGAANESLVEIASGSSVMLLERLRAGYMELILGRCPALKEMTGLNFEQLYVDRHIFVVRPNHPLAGLKRLEPKRIANYTIVMPPRPTLFWQEIHQFFLTRGISPKAAQIEVIDLSFCRCYTLASEAVWIASQRAVGQDLGSGKLVRLALEPPPSFEAPIGIITRRTSSPDREVQRFIALIRDASQGIG